LHLMRIFDQHVVNNYYFRVQMKPLQKYFLIFFLLSIPFFGNGQDASLNTNPAAANDIIEENTLGYYSQIFGFPISSIKNKALFETISNWLGTPYSYSGKTSNGIDCSGFVSMLYKKAYDILLTGNAAELYSKADLIKSNALQEGDLVFFRIRKRKISHVGIYIGENKFAHATVHNGVIISDLGEPYYRKYFVKGGKIKNTF
jgi:lipoprotein Spr